MGGTSPNNNAGLLPAPSNVFAAGMTPFCENAGLAIRSSSADVKGARPG